MMGNTGSTDVAYDLVVQNCRTDYAAGFVAFNDASAGGLFNAKFSGCVGHELTSTGIYIGGSGHAGVLIENCNFDKGLGFKVTSIDANSASGQAVLSIASTAGFVAGRTVNIDPGGAKEETKIILSVTAGVSITLTTNLANTHLAADSDPVRTQEYVEDTTTYRGGIVVQNCTDLRVLDNVVRGNGITGSLSNSFLTGVHIANDCPEAMIRGNTLSYCGSGVTKGSIMTGSSNCSTTNILDNCVLQAINDSMGILVQDTSSIIRGNRITGTDRVTTTGAIGIYIKGTYALVEGNFLSAVEGCGINSTGDHTAVRGNLISGVTSVTEVVKLAGNYSACDGNTFQITDATSVDVVHLTGNYGSFSHNNIEVGSTSKVIDIDGNGCSVIGNIARGSTATKSTDIQVAGTGCTVADNTLYGGSITFASTADKGRVHNNYTGGSDIVCGGDDVSIEANHVDGGDITCTGIRTVITSNIVLAGTITCSGNQQQLSDNNVSGGNITCSGIRTVITSNIVLTGTITCSGNQQQLSDNNVSGGNITCSGDRQTISNNDVSGGIITVDGNWNQIVHNSMEDGASGGRIVATSLSLYTLIQGNFLGGGSTYPGISAGNYSRVLDNQDSGGIVVTGNDAIISRNYLTGGIVVTGNGNVVSHNIETENIACAACSGLTIEGNTAQSSSTRSITAGATDEADISVRGNIGYGNITVKGLTNLYVGFNTKLQGNISVGNQVADVSGASDISKGCIIESNSIDAVAKGIKIYAQYTTVNGNSIKRGDIVTKAGTLHPHATLAHRPDFCTISNNIIRSPDATGGDIILNAGSNIVTGNILTYGDGAAPPVGGGNTSGAGKIKVDPLGNSLQNSNAGGATTNLPYHYNIVVGNSAGLIRDADAPSSGAGGVGTVTSDGNMRTGAGSPPTTSYDTKANNREWGG
jgi:hypothetical protein